MLSIDVGSMNYVRRGVDSKKGQAPGSTGCSFLYIKKYYNKHTRSYNAITSTKLPYCARTIIVDSRDPYFYTKNFSTHTHPFPVSSEIPIPPVRPTHFSV